MPDILKMFLIPEILSQFLTSHFKISFCCCNQFLVILEGTMHYPQSASVLFALNIRGSLFIAMTQGILEFSGLKKTQWVGELLRYLSSKLNQSLFEGGDFFPSLHSNDSLNL